MHLVQYTRFWYIVSQCHPVVFLPCFFILINDFVCAVPPYVWSYPNKKPEFCKTQFFWISTAIPNVCSDPSQEQLFYKKSLCGHHLPHAYTTAMHHFPAAIPRQSWTHIIWFIRQHPTHNFVMSLLSKHIRHASYQYFSLFSHLNIVLLQRISNTHFYPWDILPVWRRFNKWMKKEYFYEI